MWGFDEGGYDGFGAGGGNYGRFRDKSDAATRREEAATAAFKNALKDTDLQGQPFVKITALLTPSTHLTNSCWTTFSKFVKTHEGCSAKRRVATPEEKIASKETRKGNVYWVDVIVTLKAQQKALGIAMPPTAKTVEPASAKPAALGTSTNTL